MLEIWEDGGLHTLKTFSTSYLNLTFLLGEEKGGLGVWEKVNQMRVALQGRFS